MIIRRLRKNDTTSDVEVGFFWLPSNPSPPTVIRTLWGNASLNFVSFCSCYYSCGYRRLYSGYFGVSFEFFSKTLSITIFLEMLDTIDNSITPGTFQSFKSSHKLKLSSKVLTFLESSSPSDINLDFCKPVCKSANREVSPFFALGTSHPAGITPNNHVLFVGATPGFSVPTSFQKVAAAIIDLNIVDNVIFASLDNGSIEALSVTDTGVENRDTFVVESSEMTQTAVNPLQSSEMAIACGQTIKFASVTPQMQSVAPGIALDDGLVSCVRWSMSKSSSPQFIVLRHPTLPVLLIQCVLYRRFGATLRDSQW